MLPLNQYAKYKDRYCITYLGPNGEYLLLLSYLRTAIEAELPGIQIYLCGREGLLPQIERVFGDLELEEKKKEMAYVREITCDMIHYPVEQLIDESSLQLTHWISPTQKSSKGKNYVLCPNSSPPTKTLTPQQIDKLRNKFGHFEITDNVKHADWVIGVENTALLQALMLGIKTTLIPKGLGTSFWKKLFPSLEIMHL
jgi:hypothetical protein